MRNKNADELLSRRVFGFYHAPKLLFILAGAAGAWGLIALIVQLTYSFAS
jgi:hypothetical protein